MVEMMGILIFLFGLWFVVYSIITMIRINDMTASIEKMHKLAKFKMRIKYSRINYCPECLEEFKFKTWKGEPITKCPNCNNDLIASKAI